ncbi:fibronectin type III domain-containing protein, partial [Flavobacteriaceae bacterium]|nr:fibronectin type III domain-containing protein [Flavobacteriaceae bacterium]
APRTGAGMALFKTSTTGAKSTLATPSQDLTSFTNPMLTFYYTSVNWYGDIDDLSVYYKDSASGTWTLIQTYTDEVTDWLKVELILPDPSDDYFIGFEGDSDWARGITLDDVSISEAPSCTSPSALSAASITATSAEISWTSDGTLFNIEYGPAGFTQGNGTSDTSTTASYSLSGLNSNSEYDVYVQTDCGSGETSDWNSFSFSTFNSASCGETVTYTQVANGDYSIILTGGNPAMVTVNGNLETSWDGGCYDYIYVRDGSGNLINTVQSCGIFEDVTYTSTDGTISVQITNDSSTQYGDISLQFACEMPSCIKPTDLAVSDVTTDSATIAWTSDGTLFNIEYGPAGFTQGSGTSDTSTTASYALTGLNSGSGYDVYVQTDCGATEGTSDWSSTSVSTLLTNDSCDTATVVDTLPFLSNGDASSATNNNGFISDCGYGMNDGVWYTFTPTVGGTLDLVLTTSWDSEIAVYSGSCGVFTCVDYVDDPEPQTLSISVVAGTQYWVNIGSYSGTSDNSEGLYEFRATSTDASLGIEEASMEQFTYFPNPVNDVLTIKAQKTVEDITVFNMLGQVVKRQTPNTRDCTVDLSAMQTGAYFVQVSIDNTVETVRVLKN